MSGEFILLGTRKGLIILKQSKGKWAFHSLSHQGAAVSYAAVDARHGNLWACLDHGHWGVKLHRSHDGGATWEELTAPKYPENAEFGKWIPPDQRTVLPATLKYLWVFAEGGVDQGERIYFGTEPGGLFFSDDNGATIQLNEGLWNHPSRIEKWTGGGRDNPGIHSVVVDPNNSQHVYAAISCAGVFETTDGGKTWNPRNQGVRADYLPDPNVEVGHDTHLLVLCRKNPKVLWQQNHCGIFRSTDGGQKWDDISEPEGPARFGFSIAADPEDENTAWVVPASADVVRIACKGALCVCRTGDGGKTWTALRRGLPQKDCYDISLRHALDFQSNALVFGTTTGNVYFSPDRGESWECLGNNYPPIYSVRFA